MTVIAFSIASSTPGGMVVPSGDSGAQSRDARVAGAVHSGAEVRGGYARAFQRGSVTPKQDLGTFAPDQTAGSSVLPTALIPAASTPIVRFAVPGLSGGRRTAARTLEVALQSGGEANYAAESANHLRAAPTPEGSTRLVTTEGETYGSQDSRVSLDLRGYDRPGR